MIVELAPEVTASLRAMKDGGTPPPRCHSGVIRSAIAGAGRRLVDEDVLVAELLPRGKRIVFRGVDDEWRRVRFADGDDVGVRPETARRVELHGWGPDSVLAALGIVKPDGVELEVVSEGGRSILTEKVKNEIYDGTTPYSTYVRGVIVDGDRGMLLTGSAGSAVVIEG